MAQAESAGRPTAVIVDVDGTVAVRDQRGPYDETRVAWDAPNEPVIELVKVLHRAGHRIVFVSGRSSASRADTRRWLELHVGVPIAALHMREQGDRRRDADLKEELYRRHIEPRFEVLWVLDDRDQTVERWRSLGLTCLQVAEGDF
ncbi:phosphatase domain-containing protein [Glycomyces tarimensis]